MPVPRLLAALLACAAVHPASADTPQRLSFLIGSHHLDATTEFEEFNPGVFADWLKEDGTSFSLGVYRNSYGRISVAGMAGLAVFQSDTTRLDLFAGLAHYPGDGDKTKFSAGDIVPLAGVRVEHRGAFLLAIPGDGEATNAILGFGFTIPLGR